MKYLAVAGLLILLLGGSVVAFKSYESRNMPGSDRDEHGCIPSAGYTWCEAKQKCLRVWEEPCDSENSEITVNAEQSLKDEIKQKLISKHGESAETLEISVAEIEGDYAKGGASEVGLGGGMWFAARVNGVWQLVWDGNGIITCEDLTDYPEFPTSMIPECFDEITKEMADR